MEVIEPEVPPRGVVGRKVGGGILGSWLGSGWSSMLIRMGM